MNQLLPFLGQIAPRSGHLQKLMVLLALRHLLGKDAALFRVFSVFSGGFHE